MNMRKNVLGVVSLVLALMLSCSGAHAQTAPASTNTETPSAVSVPVSLYYVDYNNQQFVIEYLAQTIRVPKNKITPIGVKEWNVFKLHGTEAPLVLPKEVCKRLEKQLDGVPDYRVYDNKHPYRYNFQQFHDRWGSFIGQAIGTAITVTTSIH